MTGTHRDFTELPLKRNGLTEDAAEAVMWLCSGTTNFVTGQSLGVDGGLAIWRARVEPSGPSKAVSNTPGRGIA